MSKISRTFKLRVFVIVLFIIFILSLFLQKGYISSSIEKARFGNAYLAISFQVIMIDILIFSLLVYFILIKDNKLRAIFRNNTFKNFLVLFISLFLFLVIFEVFLRISGFSLSTVFFKILVDSEFKGYNYSLTPNNEGYFIMPDELDKEERYYKLNRFGDRTMNECPTNSSKIIFMVGDSFTWGVGVSQKRPFSEIIENRSYLGDSCILNLGSPGYGTYDVLSKLNADVKNYGKPDIIVLNFFNNDFFENYRLLKFYNIIAQNPFIIFKSFEFFFKPYFVKELDKTRYMHFAVNPEYRGFFLVTKPLIKELKDFAEMQNATLYISYIPSKEEIYNQTTGVGAFFEHKEEFDLTKPRNIVLGFAKDLDIESIDCYARLKEVAKDEELFFDIDDHFNNKAHEEYAECLSSELRRLESNPHKKFNKGLNLQDPSYFYYTKSFSN